MSTNIVYNGVTYTIPATDDVAWGDAVSAFLIAIPSGMLTKVGGSWALTGSDLDLGATYGISSIYYKTKTATPALAGILRLAYVDSVAWRAEANNKDLVLKPNSANLLTWDAIALVDISTAQVLTNKAINAPDNTITEIKNVNISATAAIAYSKIAVSAAEIPWTTVDTIGKIKNADVASDAAIDASKISGVFDPSTIIEAGGFRLGTTFKVTLTGDPSENYGLKWPDTAGVSGQALVRSTTGLLAWAAIPSLALNQYNILIGAATNLPVSVDTNALGDIAAVSTTGLTIKALSITNAMINATAAIAFSKLEALPLPLAGGTLTGLVTLDNLGMLIDVAGTTPAAPAVGQIYWDKVNQTAALQLLGTGVVLPIGQKMHIYCLNSTIAIIPLGSIVYVSGASTGVPDISLAKGDARATADGTIGIARQAIGIGAKGYVTTVGTIGDLKTDVDCDGTPLIAGDLLYLSPLVAGGYTKTVSLLPAHQVKIGIVLVAHATTGSILCKVEIGSHMSELHDVKFASLANRDLLEYDLAAVAWKNYVNPSIVTKEPTGFSTVANMILTWNEGASRDLTITNTVGPYDYWIQGVNYIILINSTKTKQVTATEGMWYFYFDTTKTLQAVQGFTASLLNAYAIAFAGYWDATNLTWIVRSEERHGIAMDWATHIYLHQTRGAVYYSGGALTTSANVAATVLAASPSAASNDLIDTQIGFDTLTMFDEDIELVLSPLTRITSPIRKLYRSGATGDWRVHAPSGLTIEPTIAAFGDVDTGTTGLCYINTIPAGSWQLTAVSNNNYFNTYVFGTNDLTAANQFILIPGQAVSGTLAGAQALSVSQLALGSLPTPEMIAIYKFTWQYKDGSRGSGPAANPVGVILHRVEDLRLAKVTGSSTTVAGVHNSLSGRSTPTAHPADAITNVPSGNLAATDQQGVNNELQSDIDTRLTAAGQAELTNKDIDGGTATDLSRITVPKAATATLAGLTRKEATLLFDSTTKKLKVDDGALLKVVGGGLIVTILDAPATSGVNLESGKHYIVTGLTADTTLNLPQGADESALRVSVYNNLTSGFRVTLAAYGSDTIAYNSTTTETSAKIMYADDWVEFSWRTTYWTIDCAASPLNGTFSGAIEFTGLVTASAGIKLPTSGGTAATLSHYEEYSYTGTWNISGSTTTSTLYFCRVGKIVQLTVSDITHTLTGGASFFALNAAIPARFRPQQVQSYFPIAVKDNAASLSTPGLFYMDSGGNIGIYKNILTDNFTNGSVSGTVSATHVSYVTS
jgi:hypothetical protein